MKANTQKAAQAEQSLNRAINGQSVQNDMIVMKEFSNRGIVATPRVDVFTYNIWKFQKGRQVKKGEKSVKVRTFIEDKKTGKTRCSTACLFHISQTFDPLEAPITKADLEDLKTDPDKPIRIEKADDVYLSFSDLLDGKETVVKPTWDKVISITDEG